MARNCPIDGLIEGIYAAAVAPESWAKQLRVLSEALQCGGVVLFATATYAPAILFARAREIPPDKLVEYDQHYLAIDPRVRYCQENPTVPCVFDALHVSEAEMDRSEYYDWLRSYGYRYYVGAQWKIGADALGYVAFQRTPGQGHVTAEQVALFERLLPHIRRGVEITRRFEETDLRLAGANELVDGLTHGVILLDRTGRVLFANQAAQRMVAEGDGLAMDGVGLRSLHNGDNGRLQALIRAAIATGLGGAGGAGGAMTLMRPSGHRPYAVTVSPLSPHETLFALARPAAAVFLSDPETAPQPPAERLRDLYGLTAREAALAAALAAGAPLEAAAESISMARETARHHLKNVFRKTGAHRQAELVRLLLTLPPDRGPRR